MWRDAVDANKTLTFLNRFISNNTFKLFITSETLKTATKLLKAPGVLKMQSISAMA